MSTTEPSQQVGEQQLPSIHTLLSNPFNSYAEERITLPPTMLGHDGWLIPRNSAAGRVTPVNLTPVPTEFTVPSSSFSGTGGRSRPYGLLSSYHGKIHDSSQT
jgi:hypothetical protein